MANKLDLDVHRPALERAHSEFHYAYGLVLAEWSGIEASLYDWFAIITKMHDRMARGVFYSARSFNARAEMLDAALSHSGQSAFDREFVQEVLRKAWTYSGFRNRVTHGEKILNLVENNPERADFVLVEGKNIKGEGTTVEHLRIATGNFRRLRDLSNAMQPIFRSEHDLSPTQCLTLVRALPNQPNSKVDPTAPGPEVSLQPEHRNKKAFRAEQKTKSPRGT